MGRDRAADFAFHQGEESPLPPVRREPALKEKPAFAWGEDVKDRFRIDPQALADQGLETDTDAEKRVADMPQGNSPEDNLARTEAREEMEELIRALREKISLAKLDQADSGVQIAALKKQIEETTEDVLPALTGERIKQLKEHQERKQQADEVLRASEEKLKRAEARYQTAFPDMPLPSEGM